MLTQSAQYALRAMCWMALRPGAMASNTALARHTGAPPTYLSKILHRLVQAALVEARRGLGGGFRLARPPEEIRLADVVRALEDPTRKPRYPSGPGAGAGSLRPLHILLGEITDAMIARLDEVTLAELMASGAPTDGTATRRGSHDAFRVEHARIAT